jgi:hypothetical protein
VPSAAKISELAPLSSGFSVLIGGADAIVSSTQTAPDAAAMPTDASKIPTPSRTGLAIEPCDFR